MNKKKISSILGVGLAIVLAFVLVGAGLPANQAQADPGTLKWTKTGTPSMFNNVLAPGTELYDMAIGSDGDTVYVVGALGPAPCGLGVSGKFEDIVDGTINIDCDGSICGTISGIADTTLIGAFNADITLMVYGEEAGGSIWGNVTS